MLEKSKQVIRGMPLQSIEAIKDYLMTELIPKWTTASTKMDTEFDTIWDMASKEGKVQGILELLIELENYE